MLLANFEHGNSGGMNLMRVMMEAHVIWTYVSDGVHGVFRYGESDLELSTKWMLRYMICRISGKPRIFHQWPTSYRTAGDRSGDYST